MNSKPLACKSCSITPCSFGFVPDLEPPDPWVYLIRRQPTKEEVSLGEAGFKDYWQELMGGIPKCNVGYTSLIRCSYDVKKIPVALLKVINICRVHDSGIERFNPNAFIITYDINEAFKIPAYKVFIRRAFEIAKLLKEKDLRPAILMGHEVAKAINPHLFADTGNERGTTFKDWVGHWWVGEWPFETKKDKFLKEIK